MKKKILLASKDQFFFIFLRVFETSYSFFKKYENFSVTQKELRKKVYSFNFSSFERNIRTKFCFINLLVCKILIYI
jgi:hypothetical protein